jgi:hypothetical protein
MQHRIGGAVALQCGNADIDFRGTQSLRMQQAVALYARYSARAPLAC